MEPLTIILAICGIIATVLAACVGTYYTVRKRHLGEISFFKEDVIPLFDSIVKNVPELSVLYKGEPVDKGLVLLKGALLNTGARDITEDMVEEPLLFTVPQNWKWHEFKVISQSPKVRAHVTVSRNSVTVQTGLFRCNEYIRVEALSDAAIPKGATKPDTYDIKSRFEEALTISHRIANTKPVTIRAVPHIIELQRGLLAFGRTAFLVVVLVTGMYLVMRPPSLPLIQLICSGSPPLLILTVYALAKLRIRKAKRLISLISPPHTANSTQV